MGFRALCFLPALRLGVFAKGLKLFFALFFAKTSPHCRVVRVYVDPSPYFRQVLHHHSNNLPSVPNPYVRASGLGWGALILMALVRVFVTPLRRLPGRALGI